MAAVAREDTTIGIFERASDLPPRWAQTGTLSPLPGPPSAIALHGDTLVAAVPRTTDSHRNPTPLVVFVRSPGGTWSQTSRLALPGPSDTTYGDIALALNGDTLVATDVEDELLGLGAGAAHVFARTTTGAWAPITTLRPRDGDPNGGFGATIALEDDLLAIGADFGYDEEGRRTPAVYLFRRTPVAADPWTEVGEVHPPDGAGPLALSGGTLLIGQPEATVGANAAQGRVLLYTPDQAERWDERGQLTVVAGTAGDRFGASLGGTGTAVVVGAPGGRDPLQSPGQRARIHAFARSGDQWVPLPAMLPGTNVGLSYPKVLPMSGGVLAAAVWEYQSFSYIPVEAAYVYEFHALPVATPDSASTPEDTPVLLDVLANDGLPAGAGTLDPASLAIVQPPFQGSAVVESGRIRYTPLANLSGADRLIYRIASTTGVTSTAVVTITVAPVADDPPLIFAPSLVRAAVSVPLAERLQASDPDQDQVPRISLVAGPPWLSLSDQGDGYALLAGTPAEADVGQHTIRVAAVDPTGLRTEVTFPLVVEPFAPPAPINLRAVAQPDGQIVLSWDAVEATGLHYRVERQDASGVWVHAGDVRRNNRTFFDVRRVCPGSYTYRVVAVGPRASATSGSVDAVLSVCPLAPPAGLTATILDGSTIGLSWSPPGDQQVSDYLVERESGAGWQQIAWENVPFTTYRDAPLECNRLYRYRVRAANAFSVSGAAEVQATITSCAITAPRNLTAAQGDGDSIVLAWEDRSDNEIGFVVERSLDGGGTWAEVDRAPRNAQGYTDTTLSCRVTARYRVTAFTSTGRSAPTNVVTATTADRCEPAAVESFGPLAVGRRMAAFTWTHPGGATGFVLERAPVGDERWAEVSSVGPDLRRAVDASASCATAYRYRVRARNASGLSAPSTPLQVVTAPCDGPIYVRADATGVSSGTSWATAHADLQFALAEARRDDQIWVTRGTYRPDAGGDRARAFELRSGVAIYGGFTGGETSLEQRDWRANPSVLSGNVGDPANPRDNSLNVVRARNVGTDAVIDGFTVRDGYADGSWAPPEGQTEGGGMFSYGGSPTVRNMIFTANRAQRGGGFTAQRSSPRLSNVLFFGNIAEEGGGMAAWDDSSPSLFQAVFSGNRGIEYGGGLYIYWRSTVTLTQATFEGNTGGGAAITINASGFATLANSVIGPHDGTWNLITNRSANGGVTLFDSVIAVGNSSCCITYTGERVTVAAARFVDADGPDNRRGTPDDDLRLSAGSPGIDSGDNNQLSSSDLLDLNGAPRRADDFGVPDTGLGTSPLVDAGAYEYQPPPPPTASPATLQATAASRVRMALRWSAPVVGTTELFVERLGVDGSWEPIARLPATNSSYADAGLACNTTYSYRLRAFSPGGGAEPGPIATATTEPCVSRVVYVDAAARGAATGRSWADAYPDLRLALGPDSLPGDEIWVAAGVYRPGAPGDGAATFRLRDGISLYGGFRGDETERTQRDWTANPTILSGDLAGNDPASLPQNTPIGPSPFDENSARVVTAIGVRADTTFDGFTILGGNSATGQRWLRGAGLYLEGSSLQLRNLILRRNMGGDGAALVAFAGSDATMEGLRFEENLGRRGGALFVQHSSPTIRTSVFRNNTSEYDDGGGAFVLLSKAQLRDVVFVANQAYEKGGGLMVVASAPTLRDVRFEANRALCGGGMGSLGAAPLLEDVTFFGNTTTYCGGGAAYYEASAGTLRRVNFERNIAGGLPIGGGGMLNVASAPVLIDVSFVGNRAPAAGAMRNEQGSAPLVVNGRFSGNVATGGPFFGEGGGAIVSIDSAPRLVNVALAGNTAHTGGAIVSLGAGAPRLTNAVVWGNSATAGPAEIAGEGAARPVIRFSIVSGGYEGEGNQDADLQFVDLNGADGVIGTFDDNLRLLPGSPAIDAGDSGALPSGIVTDFDGNERRVDDPAAPDRGLPPLPVVDLGPYEAASAPPPGTTPTATPTPTTTPTSAPGFPPTATVRPVTPTATAPALTPTAVVPAAPTAALDSTIGRPGSIFTIRGTGFAPSSRYWVRVGGTVVGEVTSNNAGTFVLWLATQSEAVNGAYIVTLSDVPATGDLQGDERMTMRYTLRAAADLLAPDPLDTAQELRVPVELGPTDDLRVFLPLLRQ